MLTNLAAFSGLLILATFAAVGGIRRLRGSWSAHGPRPVRVRANRAGRGH